MPFEDRSMTDQRAAFVALGTAARREGRRALCRALWALRQRRVTSGCDWHAAEPPGGTCRTARWSAAPQTTARSGAGHRAGGCGDSDWRAQPGPGSGAAAQAALCCWPARGSKAACHAARSTYHVAAGLFAAAATNVEALILAQGLPVIAPRLSSALSTRMPNALWQPWTVKAVLGPDGPGALPPAD